MTEVALPALPKRLASLVKIEHTVFALPFAYVGAVLCLRRVDRLPSGHQILWITVAMVGARSLAMALNRLIDREIDARNPRTATRELPSGQLRTWHVVAFCLVALAIFLVAVLQLAHIVRYLWPIPVAGFVAYPYLKRFTWLCHLWLGIVDGLAPVGGWVAVTGHMPWQAWALGGAVALWIAGFDLFYALFDREIDIQQGLHSWATRFGVSGSFAGARAFHLGAVALLGAVGLGLEVGALYWAGVAAVAALLLYEHLIVSPRDLSRLNAAFFTVNGVLSVVFFAFVLADATL
ncbi:MAG: 4-hydroxybenzoate polyprenyltransferase [Gaiellaceae bacterium]|nr:4-hydroxybenzoate polyprenyltransferase [Gaiellaceae bacterium]